jgi:hypothetical protein
MVLALPAARRPPKFSILEFVEQVKADLVLERLSPLHKFELDTTHEPVPGIWRPSGLRRCMRKQVYKASGVPRGAASYDKDKQGNFDRGHVFGAWFAAYLAALEGRYGFTVVHCELVLHDEGTAIGGKADVVLSKDGHKYVVEIKSKVNATTMQVVKPNKIDLAQLNDYMVMAGAKAGWLVYFGVGFVKSRGAKPRTGIVAREFFHRVSEDMWDDSQKKVQLLSWFLRDQTKLAPKTHNTFFECRGCEWRGVCDLELSPVEAKK